MRHWPGIGRQVGSIALGADRSLGLKSLAGAATVHFGSRDLAGRPLPPGYDPLAGALSPSSAPRLRLTSFYLVGYRW